MDPVTEHQLLTSYDIYLFKEGKHFKLHEKLGSHPIQLDGLEGTHFAVWAPNAKHVSVIGDFNETCLALGAQTRSEEHTSELQSRLHLVCRLLLEKKKKAITDTVSVA